MDGVISLPIAFASYFLLPDFPFNTRVFYLNENVRLVLIIFHSSLTCVLGQEACNRANCRQTQEATIHKSKVIEDRQGVARLPSAPSVSVSIFPLRIFIGLKITLSSTDSPVQQLLALLSRSSSCSFSPAPIPSTAFARSTITLPSRMDSLSSLRLLMPGYPMVS